MKLGLALLVLLSLALCALALSPEEQAFQSFLSKFNKRYSGQQYFERLEVFKRNLKIAAEIQARDSHATWGVTKFMDLSPEEFRDFYLIKNFTRHSRDPARQWKASKPAPEGGYPTSYDWNSKGVVTPVYNQGQCGSCWAFSTTENIESMWAIAGHGLGTLSMQQIVDCDTTDAGCNGGNPPTAYQYVMGAGGLDSYNSYPYVGYQTSCTFSPSAVAATIQNWQWVTQNDNENAMQSFTYSDGPPSICVDATIWQYYTGGIVTTSSGCGYSLDHCVQLTGWQMSGSMMVWNVRNSWGSDWGPNGGYIYVEAGYDVCGIGQECTSSIV